MAIIYERIGQLARAPGESLDVVTHHRQRVVASGQRIETSALELTLNGQ